MIDQEHKASQPPARLNHLLQWLGVPRSTWYSRRNDEEAKKKPGPKPKPVPERVAEAILNLAEQFPWWGYKRIAVLARRLGAEVSNKQAYRSTRRSSLLT